MFLVATFLTFSIVIFQVSESTSQNTGFNPALIIASKQEIIVKDGTMTSSFSLNPCDSRAIINAAVPLLVETQYFLSNRLHNSYSKSLTIELAPEIFFLIRAFVTLKYLYKDNRLKHINIFQKCSLSLVKLYGPCLNSINLESSKTSIPCPPVINRIESFSLSSTIFTNSFLNYILKLLIYL